MIGWKTRPMGQAYSKNLVLCFGGMTTGPTNCKSWMCIMAHECGEVIVPTIVNHV